ncbi:MAG: hypothetical protein IJX65_07895 [Alistipes sp.]|nr:hypothetical protein [Alistipes sp.]
MKKYIILALVALFSLSSCVLDDGTTRDPNKANEVLVRKVISSLSPTLRNVKYILYADAVVEGRESDAKFIKSHYFPNATIETADDKITITESLSNNQSMQSVVTTGGVKLTEGGSWTLEEVSGDKTILVGTYTGVQGAECTFTTTYTNGKEESEDYSVKILYSLVSNGIKMKVWGAGDMELKRSYTMSFTIDDNNPLIHYYSNTGGSRDTFYYINYFGGAMNIAYTDLVDNTSREVNILFDDDGDHIYN